MNINLEPCTNVQECTILGWFAKINEELDEFKEAVLKRYNNDAHIAAEAIDTMTTLVSMLHDLGISEEIIATEAEYVIEHNMKRGRFEK